MTSGQETHSERARDSAGQLRRRRAASWRLPVLASGRADPWHYPPPETTDRNVAGYRAAARHLLGLGLLPYPFLPELRVLWRRGGDDQRLVREVAERWDLAA